MSDFRITIPRPIVKLQGRPRRRISPTESKEKLSSTLGPTRYLSEYEGRILKLLPSCLDSRNPIFISTVLLVCSIALPAIWFCIFLQIISTAIRQRFPYASLIMTVLGIFGSVGLLAFPTSASFILLLVCVTVRWAETISSETRRLGSEVNTTIRQLDVYLGRRWDSFQATAQDTIGLLLDHLEERWHKELRIPHQLEPHDIPPSPSIEEESLINEEPPAWTKCKFDIELGRQSRVTGLEVDHNPRTPLLESAKHYYPAPTISEREAKLQLLRQLRPSTEAERTRLRTIPGFDADSWILVNNPWIDEKLERGRPVQVLLGKKRRVTKSL